jgi:hypothetical protein
LEKSRILEEAFYDSGMREGAGSQSPGEVDALSDSIILGVTAGDVMRDPKLRPKYEHPVLCE